MQLGDVLSQLASDQQRAVTLVYFDDRSIDEAARTLAVEPAAVRGWLTAAGRSVARWALEDTGTGADTGGDAAAPSVATPLPAPAHRPVSPRARAS